MAVDAFVLRIQAEGVAFATLFLASKDFDMDTLRSIAQELGITVGSKKRGELIDLITARIERASPYSTSRLILEHLIRRRKEWVSVKLGRVGKTLPCRNIAELALEEGRKEWYGPIVCPHDRPETSWYIRPVFVPHWEIDERDGEPQRVEIRWLCFARVTTQSISLHWRGFSYSDAGDAAASDNVNFKNSQFPYWEHIPALFDEIEDLTRADVKYAELHNLMLHQLWGEYQANPDYKWTHRRIRAESSGVSLNAHAGSLPEIDAGGILNLATTIRRAIQHELDVNYRIQLPEPAKFDEVVLRTLIREYGALSYEFSLEKDGKQVFRAHTYFGLKENSNSADRFPHLKLFISRRDDLEQLDFITDYLNKHPIHEIFEPQRLPLFE